MRHLRESFGPRRFLRTETAAEDSVEDVADAVIDQTDYLLMMNNIKKDIENEDDDEFDTSSEMSLTSETRVTGEISVTSRKNGARCAVKKDSDVKDKVSNSSNQLTTAMLADVAACSNYNWSQDDCPEWTQYDFPDSIS